MTSHPPLHHQLMQYLGQHTNYSDYRHLITLSWIVVGWLMSQSLNLTEWEPFVASRANKAESYQKRWSRFLMQSLHDALARSRVSATLGSSASCGVSPQSFAQIVVRRLAGACPRTGLHRFLQNSRVDEEKLYLPLIMAAINHWSDKKIYLALDTTVLWNQYCMIHLSIIGGGRAIPFLWQVKEHQSATISFAVYRELLRKASWLLPHHNDVMLLADRGFAHQELLKWLNQKTWHYCLRIPSDTLVHGVHRWRACPVSQLRTVKGEAKMYHQVRLWESGIERVNLAHGYPTGATEAWTVRGRSPLAAQPLSGQSPFRTQDGRFASQSCYARRWHIRAIKRRKRGCCACGRCTDETPTLDTFWQSRGAVAGTSPPATAPAEMPGGIPDSQNLEASKMLVGLPKAISLRFRVEELFSDSKSGVFGLADSRLRTASKLSRLYLVVASAIFYSTVIGTTVQLSRLRTQVDVHFCSQLELSQNWSSLAQRNHLQE